MADGRFCFCAACRGACLLAEPAADVLQDVETEADANAGAAAEDAGVPRDVPRRGTYEVCFFHVTEDGPKDNVHTVLSVPDQLDEHVAKGHMLAIS